MDLLNIFLAAGEVAVTAAEHTDQSLLGTLGIDLKLFIAQLINFGIILIIFWKWIAKPLGKLMTERQERIESGLRNADLMEKEKKNFDAWREQQMTKSRIEAESIIKSATDAAQQSKQEIIDEAHSQSEQILNQTKAQIEVEKGKMLKEVRQEVATLVVLASEKIIRKKLDSKTDQELIAESVKTTR